MHTALMAQTTAFLVPGSSHSVTVTNLVILLFESQTRLAKDIQISVGEDSFTERLQAIPKQFRLEQWTVSRKVRSNQSWTLSFWRSLRGAWKNLRSYFFLFLKSEGFFQM